ncbi:MAG: hypothetical protein IH991_01985, partial [Planctomycetes bacterium]|nr:hypothetical protein [Planctomycetota bacterium]
MRRFRCGCLIACVGVINALTQAVDAGLPSVQFDVARTIECRDVTPAKFSAANPDERLVEATFEVSSLIRGDNKDDLIEIFYEVVCRRKDCKVVDYLPRTTLATNLAGNIGIEKKQEQVRSLRIGVSGVLESVVKINGTGDVGSKRNSSVRYELLPPMETVAASGTIGRSTGVYFRLRSSRQTSLEGSKQFVLVLRVPR